MHTAPLHVNQAVISAEAAHACVGAAVKAAHAMGLCVNVAVLDASGVIYTDTSGADALHNLWQSCQKTGVRLVLTGLNQQTSDLLRRTNLLEQLGASNVQAHWEPILKTLGG